MKLQKFKSFVNELIKTKEELYPLDEIEHQGKKDPALYTWDEYFEEVNQGKKGHSDSAYNYSIDENPYSWVHLDNDKWKKIKTRKYDNIVIDYYINKEEHTYVSGRDENGNVTYHNNKELNKKGKITTDNTIVACHRDENIIVGAVQNEWGAVLISIAKEYRGLGISDELIDMYRHYFPHKGTGGVTNAGYRNLQKFHTRRVKKYLQNGVYSDMVKKGEITLQRVKEIINSTTKINKREGTELSKKYGGTKKLMMLVDESSIIIFDEYLFKCVNDPNMNDIFKKRLLKCFIYINQFKNNVDYENLFTVYAENEDFLKTGMDILMSNNVKISNYFVNKRFDDNTRNMINNIFNSDYYKISMDKNTKIASLKEKKFNFNFIKNKYDKWFKENDKYDEIKNNIMEFAEGIADTDELKESLGRFYKKDKTKTDTRIYDFNKKLKIFLDFIGLNFKYYSIYRADNNKRKGEAHYYSLSVSEKGLFNMIKTDTIKFEEFAINISCDTLIIEYQIKLDDNLFKNSIGVIKKIILKNGINDYKKALIKFLDDNVDFNGVDFNITGEFLTLIYELLANKDYKSFVKLKNKNKILYDKLIDYGYFNDNISKSIDLDTMGFSD